MSNCKTFFVFSFLLSFTAFTTSFFISRRICDTFLLIGLRARVGRVMLIEGGLSSSVDKEDSLDLEEDSEEDSEEEISTYEVFKGLGTVTYAAR